MRRKMSTKIVKNCFKKAVATILASVLMISGSFTYLRANAESTDATESVPTYANLTPEIITSGTSWNKDTAVTFWAYGTDIENIPNPYHRLEAVSGVIDNVIYPSDSGLYRNGVKSDSLYLQTISSGGTGSGKIQMAICLDEDTDAPTASHGDIVTIKGQFKHATQNIVLEFVETSFVWDANKSTWRALTTKSFSDLKPILYTVYDTSQSSDKSVSFHVDSVEGLGQIPSTYATHDKKYAVTNESKESGIYRNNVVENDIYLTAFAASGTSSMQFVISWANTTVTTISTNDTIRFKGQFEYVDVTTGIRYLLDFNETEFMWNGTNWKTVTKETFSELDAILYPAGQTSQLTSSSVSFHVDAVAGLGSIPNSTNKTVRYSANSSGGLYQNGALDSSLYLAAFSANGTTDCMQFVVALQEGTFTAKDVVKIEGQFEYFDTTNAKRYILDFNKTEFVWNGSSWEKVVTINTTYSDMTPIGLASAVLNSDWGPHWRMRINVLGTFPTSDTASKVYNIPVQVDKDGDGNTDSDASSSVQVLKSGDVLWLILGNYLDETPTKGATVSIEAGNYRDTSDAYIGISLTKDIQLKWDGEKWYYVVIADEAIATLTLDNATENGGTVGGVYLNSTDSRPLSDNPWNDNIYPVGDEISGIFYNGEKTKGYLRKYGTGKYYLSCAGMNTKATAGDIVRIQGIFSYDNYAVEYEPISLLFDGSEWHTCYFGTPQLKNAADFTITMPGDSLAYDNSAAYTFYSGGLYHNESFIIDASMKKLDETSYQIVLGNSIASMTNNDIIVLDGIVLDTEKRTAIQFARTTFQYSEGDTWTIVDNASYDKLFSLTVDMELSTVDDEGNVMLILQPSKGVLGEPEHVVWHGLNVVATSTEGTVKNLGALEMAKTNRGMLQLEIPKSQLSEDAYTIAVKTGMMTTESTGLYQEAVEVEAGAMYNSKDCFAYVNQYGVGYSKFVKRCNSSASAETMTLDSSNSSATVVSWTVNEANAMTQNVAFLPMDVDSGLFVNGIRYPEIAITKTATGVVQVDYEAQAGDHIMILGTFKNKEEFVEIDAVAATYDDTWHASEAAFTSEITLNIADDEYVVEGTDVVVKDSKGVELTTTAQTPVLYQAGEYTVVRRIGEVTINYSISLYRPHDVNQNNAYDVCDLVAKLKYTKASSYADTLNTEGSKRAVSQGTVADVREYILGITKADRAYGLPTEMIGATSVAGQYITSISGTMNGTTVIGMSTQGNAYIPTTDYDAYGLDYVVDVQKGAGETLKILQLSDTQIIDTSQGRDLGEPSESLWAPGNRGTILFDYIDKTVAEAKPDIILIAGDIIYGEFDHDGTNLQALIKHMDSLKIPWAPVYGNHDNESNKGVAWQNAELEKSTYCLFYAGHDISGNSNYSIGLSMNGTLQRVIYMMDTNFCAATPSVNAGLVVTSRGFKDDQKDWYRTTALRTNAAADKIIPSMLCYHVPTEEVWLGAKAAGYSEGRVENRSERYTIGEDYVAQAGDSGFKQGAFSGYREEGLLEIMNEVGSDGAFFGHQHMCSVSVTYGGVRWTFGLKTGAYDAHPDELGGTLISLNSDGTNFTVKHINVAE